MEKNVVHTEISAKQGIGKSFIFFLYAISGALSLTYEVIWLEQSTLVFGNSTHSSTATVSAFLAGLAVGSIIAGWLLGKIQQRITLRWYAGIELAVALTALAAFVLFPHIITILDPLSDGTQLTFGFLVLKFLLSSVLIFVPSLCMGMSLPVLASILGNQNTTDVTTSRLYGWNTLGAVLGTAVTSFVLIELFGLRGVFVTAVVINILLAALVWWYAKKQRNVASSTDNDVYHSSAYQLSRQTAGVLIVIVFVSGIVSIAYEILWIRALTPTLGTVTYAFAGILIAYLLGISLGSLLFTAMLRAVRHQHIIFAISQIGIALAALASVIVLLVPVFVPELLAIFWIVLPATFFMGLSFPAVLTILRNTFGTGRLVGYAYGFLTIGNIIGGYVASFVLIPLVGTLSAILLLASINILLAGIVLFVLYTKENQKRLQYVVFGVFIAVIVSAQFLMPQDLYEKTTASRIAKADAAGAAYLFTEDSVSSVLAVQDEAPRQYRLFVDGVETTRIGLEPKLMAHIPLGFHDNPQDMLIVAFGAGTTYRSALAHDNLNVDVVELSSAVVESFKAFHPAADVLHNPRGRVIINDGRNYIRLTDKQYDVVTIDPPPPFNSAGTNVLYAQDFYEDIRKKLQPGGIVAQWLYFSNHDEVRSDDYAMAIQSFTQSFPHVLIFRSPSKTPGLYLIGSQQPLLQRFGFLQATIASPVVQQDIAEVGNFTAANIRDMYLGNEEYIEPFIATYTSVTDNKPRIEYYLLRHTFTTAPAMSYDLLP